MPVNDHVREVYPLLWTDDVAGLADWAVNTLGLTEAWRAPGEDGTVEHAEVLWHGSRISLNISKGNKTGPSGISLRIDNRKEVDALYVHAQAAGARISEPLQESMVAYSFTVTDGDGNQWWVNAETGFLDSLRKE